MTESIYEIIVVDWRSFGVRNRPDFQLGPGKLVAIFSLAWMPCCLYRRNFVAVVGTRMAEEPRHASSTTAKHSSFNRNVLHPKGN